jgi:hypothetical protein
VGLCAKSCAGGLSAGVRSKEVGYREVDGWDCVDKCLVS